MLAILGKERYLQLQREAQRARDLNKLGWKQRGRKKGAGK